MIARLLKASLWHDRRRKIFAVINLAVGTTLATALLNLTLDVGDKMNQEMRGFGANLVLVPRDAEPRPSFGVEQGPLTGRTGIALDGLPRLKEIFWRHNIVAFAPVLEVRAAANGREITLAGTWFDRPYVVAGDGDFRTGLARVHPQWPIRGRWPVDDGAGPREALVGAVVASRLGLAAGDILTVGPTRAVPAIDLTVRGVVSTGAEEDERVFVPMEVAERVRGRSGRADRVEVSALTMPDNELARRARHGRETLTTREHDVWYCSPFVDAIAFQMEEVLPGVRAKPLRQITESEGIVVRKIQLLMAVVTGVALLGSALGVFSLMSTMVADRRAEIGLAKALGAGDGQVMRLFLAEITAAGLAGAAVGVAVGMAVCQVISHQLFGAGAAAKLAVIPVIALLSVLVSLGGGLLPARWILRVEPSVTLAGE